MDSFEDKNGKKLIVELTIGKAKRIKAKTGIDLVNPLEQIDGKTAFERIAENPLLLCDILHAMLCDEMPEESFADVLDGATIERAYESFIRELENFSLPQTRAILKKLTEMAKMAGAEQQRQLDQIPNNIGTQFTK